ncbi:Hpt domain-containing protein [Hyphobacterium sp. HN65]|uniref:Hpt domain-containing protein n=1 Tax=Hyphobacterium lacteum TaxID=3116575 RepID=A0ABU7LTD3_9PROT|nr:Hpt domain-containing protein [Hyphobacterium sp. HN65]MEE2527180.1 Hpt domain-containing protein [Hyphobacterium sp. HN65]
MANKQQPIEMITPPNMLRVKVGGRIGPVDEAAIARAEKALDDMKDVFSEWLEAEVAKLEDAAKRVQTEGVDGEAGEKLFARAHDLRGMGTTYNFPIITRMAASLSKLIETPEKRAIATSKLALAHTNAIRAALRQDIKDENDPVGRALAEEMERQVLELVADFEDQPARAAG